MPRSYLLKEPAVQRGYNNGWDAINQMNDRLNSLMIQGHEIDKLELIIEGGTYTEYPQSYLKNFHRDIFYSANTFFDKEPKRNKKTIKEEMNINIYSRVRIIGICIETRPDALSYNWIRFFRETGTTRVQLGVQHTDNYILKKINRGHTFEQSCDSIELLKNNCFKVDIHLMPDLPYSSAEKDKTMFDIIFKKNIISPDQIKIYPCEVTPYTVIEKWYKTGKYKPYSDNNPEMLLDVVKYALLLCPPWIRFPRVVRDIPLNYIQGGNKYSNLRQMIEENIKKEGFQINEMRYREIGRHLDYTNLPKKLKIRKYNKIDYFISYESYDEKVLFGFLRLRLPCHNHSYFRCLDNKGLIRELHVYNSLVPVGKYYNATQHKGIGKKLLKKAEWISWFYGYNGTAIISGEGVKGYYYKNGYKEIDTYMIKEWDYYNLYLVLVLIYSFIIILSL
jgi:ELP3 family radical SAM enzyme/protein acetyltransferase